MLSYNVPPHEINFIKEYSLYDDDYFSEYRNKFVDYNFITMLGQYFNTLFQPNVYFVIKHDKAANTINISTLCKKPDLTVIG